MNSTPNAYRYTFCALTFRLLPPDFNISSVYTPANPERIAMAMAMKRPAAGVVSTASLDALSCATVHPSASSVIAAHCVFESSFCRNSRYKMPVDTMFRFFKIW